MKYRDYIVDVVPLLPRTGDDGLTLKVQVCARDRSHAIKRVGSYVRGIPLKVECKPSAE